MSLSHVDCAFADGVQQHSSVERLVFVDGKPTEWSLVSEMQTRRECAAVAFSLTRLITAPDPKAKGGDNDAEETAENPLAEDDEAPKAGSVAARRAALEKLEQEATDIEAPENSM